MSLRVPVALIVCALLVAGCTGSSSPPGSPTATVTPSQPLENQVAAAMAAGPYDTATADYELPDLAIKGLQQPVEVQGHVIGPVGATGALPLVVFLHGFTGSCYRKQDTVGGWPCPKGFRPIPNSMGFTYLQQRLASQGFLTVSVSANGVNVQSGRAKGAGSAARATLVNHHLAAWSAGDIPNTSRWPSVDVDHVLLVGHSRGGEGMDAAVAARSGTAPWKVAGEVLMGPTEFDPAPRTTVPLVAFTGYCDGDVGPGAGQRYVDRVATDPGLLRTSIILEGANHNFFNTEWDPATSTTPGGYDDSFGEDGSVSEICQPGSPTRLSPIEQRDAAAQVMGIIAAALLRGQSAAIEVLDGAAPAPGLEAVRVSAAGHGRITYVPGVTLAATGSAGMQARLCAGESETEDRTACGYGTGEGQSVHWPDAYRARRTPPAVDLRWRAPVGGVILTPSGGPVDLTAAAGVEARIAVAPEGSPVAFDLVITDSAGASATLSGGQLTAFPDDPRLPSRRWGQRFWAPLGDDPPDVDLSSVVSLTLAPRSVAGHVWVIDVSVPLT